MASAKGRRLQYRIALATFLPLVLFALSSVGLGAYALTVVPRNLLLERQTALAKVAAAGVAESLQGQLRLLEMTADDLGRASGDLSRQRQMLSEREAILGTFAGGVRLLDSRGTVIGSTPAAWADLGASLANSTFFVAVRTGDAAVFSTVLRDEPGGRPAIVMATPVRQHGKWVGVLAGKALLDEGDWPGDLELLHTPRGGQAYLVDSAGAVIWHPDRARIGASIQADVTLLRLAVASTPQCLLYQPAGSPQRWAVAFAPIPGIPWGLIIEEPWQSVWATIVPYQWIIAGLMLTGLALAVAMLLVSVRRVMRPLGALVAEGQRVAAGQPFRPLAVEGAPDLRVLLQVVNRMVARMGDQQEMLRRYALRVLQGQEEERRRLSRELHDETVQDLVALSQRIELLADALETDRHVVAQRLADLQALSRHTLAEVRRMSNNLRPSTLEDLGLAAALQALTSELADAMPQAQAHCEIVGREVRLAPEVELGIYRIGQEALSNVRRHAISATRIRVALIYDERETVLLVEDDGPGFATASEDTSAGEHLGLLGMRERAQLLGAELAITSAPGKGTAVSLALPNARWRSEPSSDVRGASAMLPSR